MRGIGWSLHFDLWICLLSFALVCESIIYISARFFTIVSILRRSGIGQASTTVQFNAITDMRRWHCSSKFQRVNGVYSSRRIYSTPTGDQAGPSSMATAGKQQQKPRTLWLCRKKKTRSLTVHNMTYKKSVDRVRGDEAQVLDCLLSRVAGRLQGDVGWEWGLGMGEEKDVGEGNQSSRRRKCYYYASRYGGDDDDGLAGSFSFSLCGTGTDCPFTGRVDGRRISERGDTDRSSSAWEILAHWVQN